MSATISYAKSAPISMVTKLIPAWKGLCRLAGLYCFKSPSDLLPNRVDSHFACIYFSDMDTVFNDASFGSSGCKHIHSVTIPSFNIYFFGLFCTDKACQSPSPFIDDFESLVFVYRCFRRSRGVRCRYLTAF